MSVDTFLALPLQVTADLAYTRHVFIRSTDGPKDGNSAELQKGCGLFVTGLPYTHQDPEECLLELFGSFGAVSKVAVHAEKTAAIVVFAKPSSVQKVKAAAHAASPVQLRLREPQQAYGLKGAVEAHKACFPETAVLRAELDSWTEQFEQDEARRRESTAASLAEDGWTVVTRRGGGKKVSDGAGAAVGAVAPAAAQAFAAGKKERARIDFYRFQQRDKRRNELVELRQKFAEDKRRIAELKASRTFKV